MATRSYARLSRPGVYSTTITRPDLFRPYLAEQLGLLEQDYGATFEVRPSEQEIPFPYVLDGSDVVLNPSQTAAIARYFPTTDDLLNAAAMAAVVELQHDLTADVRRHLAAGADAADAVVEVVAFVYEHLRDDPALNRLLAPGRIAGTLAGLTAPSSIHLGRSLLAGFGVDWAAQGWDPGRQHELVEHLLRTLQSLVLDPGDPERSGTELRGYLQRWVAPAVRAVHQGTGLP